MMYYVTNRITKEVKNMVNDKLKKLILTKFKTESEFASRVGVTRQKMNKITQGKYIPKIGEAGRMADALEVSIDELAAFF